MTAFSDTAKKMKPAGSLRAQFILGGDIKNIKACDIDAKIESGGMSLYGLKASDVAFDYKQAEGTGRLQSARSLFYGGSLSASGKVDWLSKNLPYSFNLDIKDMKLEDFKKDTDFKDRDVSGIIKVYAGLNGLFQGSPGVAGVGKISIARGRLWQLDLFKGLGAVIFTSDFSDIVFTESSCDFRIEDKTVSSDDIILKSELVNLYGSGKIGFDRSVSASLKSELTKEAMDPGFRKNVASAIGKYTFIEISGTLTEPRYRMRPSVSEMVEDAAGALLQR
jgi:hypothetical protein